MKYQIAPSALLAGLLACSLTAGCVGSGKGKSKAYTVNGVVAGTTVAGLVVANKVMNSDEPGDFGALLPNVWGGVTLATLAVLSLVTAQMPDAEYPAEQGRGLATLELIPTPQSIHRD